MSIFKIDIPEPLLRELYAAAEAFRDAKPWEGLSDSDWFGFPDPAIGGDYPVVGATMGGAGQVFGLCLYRFPEGLYFWNEVFLTGQPSRETGMYRQRMLEISFAPREELELEDFALWESLGLKAPPASSPGYPYFRSWQPGRFPWAIDEAEAQLLLQGLRYGLAFAETGGLDKKDFEDEERRHEKGEWPRLPVFQDLPGKCTYTFGAFPRVEPSHIISPTDDLFAPRIAALPEGDDQWEVDSKPFPEPVMDKDGGAPRYLRAIVVISADGHAHMPDDPEDFPLIPFDEPLWPVVQREFTRVAEKLGSRPAGVLTASPEVALALSPLTTEIPGFELFAPGAEDPPSQSPLDGIQRLMDTGIDPDQLEKLLEGKTPDDLEALLPKLELLADLAQQEEQSTIAKSRKKKAAPRGKRLHAGKHATIRIDLTGIKPPLWRRIRVPLRCDFAMLHEIIQEAMGWEDYHLHAFEIREGHRIALRIEQDVPGHDIPNFGDADEISEHDISLGDLLQRGFKKIHYTYDFGDGWEHVLKIEEIIEDPSLPDEVVLLKGRGSDPIEDCGGPWGLQQLIQGDPGDHPFFEDMDSEEIAAFRARKYTPEEKDFSFFQPLP